LRRFTADVIACLLIAGLSLAVGLSRFDQGIDLADEGFLALGAARVAAGELPHRDFVSLQPPLSFYVAAGAFGLLGTSLVSLRWIGLLLHLLIVFQIYGLTRRLARPSLALAATLPATLLGLPQFDYVPFAAWQGVGFVLAATLALLRAASAGRGGWAIAAGVLTAAAALTRHDQAFYLAIAVLVYMLALRRTKRNELPAIAPERLLVRWIGGLALVLAPATLLWLFLGALPAMYRQLVLFPVTTYAGTSSLPMPALLGERSVGQQVVALLFYVPPVVLLPIGGWLAVRAARQRLDLEKARLVFLVVLAGLFYLQVLTRSDLQHLLITLPPFLLVVGWLLERTRRDARQWIGRVGRIRMESRTRSRVTTGLALLFLGGIYGAGWVLAGEILLPPTAAGSTRLDLERSGVTVDPATTATLEPLIREIRRAAPADRSILVLPYQPMVYFLADRRNPTRWNYIWPGDQSTAEHRELIEEARRDPPAVAILFGRGGLAHYAPEITGWLDTEYRRVNESPELSIYLPRETERP